ELNQVLLLRVGTCGWWHLTRIPRCGEPVQYFADFTEDSGQLRQSACPHFRFATVAVGKGQKNSLPSVALFGLGGRKAECREQTVTGTVCRPFFLRPGNFRCESSF